MKAALQQFVVFVRRYPLVMFSLTLFFILAIVNYFLWQRQAELSQRHDRVRQDGEAMLLALTGYPRIVTQLATVQEALTHIDQNLITEADLAENLNYFYQMETLSRIRLSQLNQLSSQPVPEGSPFKAIPFSLRITGSYAQIISFLHDLETGPRLLRVKSYNFGRGDPKTNTLALDLTVEMLGYP